MLTTLSFLLSTLAFGEPVATSQDTFQPKPFVGWALFELRGGLQAAAKGGNVTICGEIGLYKYIALDACGTGGGFLYQGTPQEMVHFRLEGSIPLWQQRRTQLILQPGFGFAELENGADDSGFLFGPARSPNQKEGAGVEGSLSAKLRIWPHERFYLVTELSGSFAWIPSAPVVSGTTTPGVPSGMLSFGIGL